MDITSHELKTMKVKQLRKLIRESISEIIAENEGAIQVKPGDLAKIKMYWRKFGFFNFPLLWI